MTSYIFNLLLTRIHHQKSRYIFDLFYKRKAISRGKWVWSSVILEYIVY